MTTTPLDANDVLMGGGVKSAEFGSIPGTTVGGIISGKPRAYHVHEYDRNNPGGGPLAYWPGGEPIMGINVDVRTSQRDPAIIADDGVRRLYIDKARQLAAVRLAVRTAGATGLEQGGYLSLTLTGTEEGKGAMPAMTWSAVYRSPSTAVPGHPNGNGQGTPPAQQYAQAPAPVQQQQYPAAQPQQAAPVYQQQGPPEWAQQQAPVQQQAPPVPQQQAAPIAAAPVPGAPAAITETMAAAMRNAGIDTSLFTVVPG